MTSSQMTIGQLARRSGISTSAIRFYERTGLIRAEGRTDGNYRYFDSGAEERLHFIRAAQASGLSLEDIRILCRFDDGATRPCRDVQAIIDLRLKEVTQQMRHLRHIQKVLRSYSQTCQKA